MKHLFLSIILSTTLISLFCQTVKNVDFSVVGEEIHITYDLLETENGEPVFVEVLYSSDKGFSYEGPIQDSIYGDIGAPTIGKEKKIVWKPLETQPWIYSDNFQIKIRLTPATGTFKDTRDGKVYKWVGIGNQIWMAENLNYKNYGSFCFLDKNEHCEKYGRLYTYSGAVGACPNGWHLPSSAEYKTMLSGFGGTGKNKSYDATINGGVSGFNVLLGGYRTNGNERYWDFNEQGKIWSSSKDKDGDRTRLILDSGDKSVFLFGSKHDTSNSVRCIKD